MRPDDHDRLREDLAGYVLGGLTVEEQRTVEAHLAECTACRADLAELDPVPVLLDLAAPAPADGPTGAATTATGAPAPARPVGAGSPPVPSAAARPAQKSRPRGTRLLLVGAGVAASLLLAFAVGIVVASPSETAYGTPLALHPVGAATATGTIAVRAGPHGTEVRLHLHHLPSAPGTWYECIWWSASGGRWSAGTFRPARSAETDVELLAAAELHPGWRVGILEHTADRATPVTVLETTT